MASERSANRREYDGGRQSRGGQGGRRENGDEDDRRRESTGYGSGREPRGCSRRREPARNDRGRESVDDGRRRVSTEYDRERDLDVDRRRSFTGIGRVCEFVECDTRKSSVGNGSTNESEDFDKNDTDVDCWETADESPKPENCWGECKDDEDNSEPTGNWREVPRESFSERRESREIVCDRHESRGICSDRRGSREEEIYRGGRLSERRESEREGVGKNRCVCGKETGRPCSGRRDDRRRSKLSRSSFDEEVSSERRESGRGCFGNDQYVCGKKTGRPCSGKRDDHRISKLSCKNLDKEVPIDPGTGGVWKVRNVNENETGNPCTRERDYQGKYPCSGFVEVQMKERSKAIGTAYCVETKRRPISGEREIRTQSMTADSNIYEGTSRGRRSNVENTRPQSQSDPRPIQEPREIGGRPERRKVGECGPPCSAGEQDENGQRWDESENRRIRSTERVWVVRKAER